MNKDVVDRLTAAVVSQLENGRVPWQRPWRSDYSNATSLATGKSYRGFNALWLGFAGEEFDGPNLWVTFNATRAAGGKVKKGSKSQPVALWKFLKKTDENGEEVTIPLLRYFNVFHVAQTEGLVIPAKYTVEREPIQIEAAVPQVLAGYVDGPTLDYRGNAAYYRPSTDEVVLPHVDQFHDGAVHAQTLFHELIHSTGHSSRLDRFGKYGVPGVRGGEAYAAEELIAEIGACLLASEVGVEARVENSAAYLRGWLEVLKDDPSLLITASGKAQKAVDRILGRVEEVEE